MKLLILLIAIYSLIFYQQYKIEKFKASSPESESKTKTTGPYQDNDLQTKQDYGNAIFLMEGHYSKSPEHPIARVNFYE